MTHKNKLIRFYKLLIWIIQNLWKIGKNKDKFYNNNKISKIIQLLKLLQPVYWQIIAKILMGLWGNCWDLLRRILKY
jgi:hypothetical protein